MSDRTPRWNDWSPPPPDGDSEKLTDDIHMALVTSPFGCAHPRFQPSACEVVADYLCQHWTVGGDPTINAQGVDMTKPMRVVPRE